MASTYHDKETDVTQTGFVHYLEQVTEYQNLIEKNKITKVLTKVKRI